MLCKHYRKRKRVPKHPSGAEKSARSSLPTLPPNDPNPFSVHRTLSSVKKPPKDLKINHASLSPLFQIVCSKLVDDQSSTASGRQHLKGLKALAVLCSLLGVSYAITMFPPTTSGISFQLFQSFRSLLLSLQVRDETKTFPTLFFCFRSRRS